jgi:hypothetical protein
VKSPEKDELWRKSDRIRCSTWKYNRSERRREEGMNENAKEIEK